MTTACEIIYTVLALAGCYLVMRKKRIGWFLWAVATPFIWIVLYNRGAYIMIPVFGVYLTLDIIGWIEWGKNEKR